MRTIKSKFKSQKSKVKMEKKMQKRQAIVMLGLPASGKGTQAEIMAKKIGARIIGIGDLVRSAMTAESLDVELLAEIKSDYDKGIPQKDKIVENLIESEIAKSSGNIIFDNYPFSSDQINFFETMITKYDFSAPKIVYIKIDPELAITRISSRRICDKCKKIYLSGKIGDNCNVKNCGGHLIQRLDDTAGIMKERISHAQPRIDLVLNHYKNSGQVCEINGEQTIEKVAEDIGKIFY
ncbi:MAG: nucleoside monophosphate kinase [Candidatus Berkelbacteria bacterium]|nr:nucleoside monophosphate kinase [Candidatus Berkelbacteria bacterium]